MADAKIKKIIGNVTKLNFFSAYIVNTSFQPSIFIDICDFSKLMVKYEFNLVPRAFPFKIGTGEALGTRLI